MKKISYISSLVKNMPSGFYYKNTLCRRISTKIRKEDIHSIVNNVNPFIKIRNYVSDEVCDHGLYNLKNHTIKEYENAHGVNKYDIGMAYFEVEDDPSLKSSYYQRASKDLIIVRKDIFGPYLSPIDKLRLDMDEIWPSGSCLLNFPEGKSFAGLIRVLNGEVLAHEDKLERDLGITLKELPGYNGQIAANIYLETPEEGGELILWPISLDNDTYQQKCEGSYGIRHDNLPPPSHIIKPEKGCLILFNPRNLHGIKKNMCPNQQSRTTVSTFIYYGDELNPLKFWS